MTRHLPTSARQPDQVATKLGRHAALLADLCVNQKPTIGWVQRFADAVADAVSEIGVSATALVNATAVELASRFLDGRCGFDAADMAINCLAGYAIARDNRPDLLWNIYLAFDAGEYYRSDENRTLHPGEEFTRPRLLQLHS